MGTSRHLLPREGARKPAPNEKMWGEKQNMKVKEKVKNREEVGEDRERKENGSKKDR